MQLDKDCKIGVLCVQLYIDFFENIVNTNGAALITALICIASIYAVQRWVNPRFKQRFKMPFPIELIAVCMQKCLSFQCLIWIFFAVESE